MKNGTKYFMGVLAILFFAGYFMLNTKGSEPNNNQNYIPPEGEVQKVVLSMKNYNYYPNTITVKAGNPVSISVDKSVYGCFRSFTIRDFGISKYLRTPEDTVEFTPTKPGTYTFACSMGMGTGTLIVK